MKNAFCLTCQSDACEHARAPVILTTRERQVLGMAGDGLTIKEMASRLGRSTKTVECQLQSLYRKLGLNGSGNGSPIRRLTVYALQHPEAALEVAA